MNDSGPSTCQMIDPLCLSNNPTTAIQIQQKFHEVEYDGLTEL